MVMAVVAKVEGAKVTVQAWVVLVMVAEVAAEVVADVLARVVMAMVAMAEAAMAKAAMEMAEEAKAKVATEAAEMEVDGDLVGLLELGTAAEDAGVAMVVVAKAEEHSEPEPWGTKHICTC